MSLEQGLRIPEHEKRMILSHDFQNQHTGSINIAIIKGEFFSDAERNNKTILEMCLNPDSAKEKFGLKLGVPDIEITCFLRQMLTDEGIIDMGLGEIIPMHEPIPDTEGAYRLCIETHEPYNALTTAGALPIQMYGSQAFRFAFKVID